MDNQPPHPNPASADAQGATTELPLRSWEQELIEKVVLQSVKAHKARHRRRWFWRGLLLLFLISMLWRFFAPAQDWPQLNTAHTALISLDGEITQEGLASADQIGTALQKAFSNRAAVGIVLRINSPGGSPVQSGALYREILRLRAQYPDKKIYTVVDDICTSGAYYVAVATHRIFVDPASLIGSIGVRMGSFGVTALMQKLGVERRLVTAGKNKGIYDPFSPVTPEQKDHLQGLLNEVHEQFVNAVRQGRGQRLKDEDSDLFSGLFWTGDQSVRLGLADGFGTVRSVAREQIKAETILDYTRKEGLANRLVRRFGMALGEGAWTASQRSLRLN